MRVTRTQLLAKQPQLGLWWLDRPYRSCNDPGSVHDTINSQLYWFSLWLQKKYSSVLHTNTWRLWNQSCVDGLSDNQGNHTVCWSTEAHVQLDWTLVFCTAISKYSGTCTHRAICLLVFAIKATRHSIYFNYEWHPQCPGWGFSSHIIYSGYSKTDRCVCVSCGDSCWESPSRAPDTTVTTAGGEMPKLACDSSYCQSPQICFATKPCKMHNSITEFECIKDGVQIHISPAHVLITHIHRKPM